MKTALHLVEQVKSHDIERNPMSGIQTTGTVTPFHYGGTAVRTVIRDGEPWFVLADLCSVLGLTTPARVADRLDQAGVSQTHISSTGQRRAVTIVNESGMYEVVIRSDKPEAVAFRRWVTAEVLPSIRTTGSFGTAPALTEDEIVAQALAITTRKVEELAKTVAELEPPAKAWNNLAAAAGNYSVSDAAKILSQDPAISIGRDRLFAFMNDAGWIFRPRNPRGGWEAYQEQVDSGRLYERPARPFLNDRTGEYELPAPTIRITVKGIERLRQMLGGSDGLVLIDGGAA
ncbi:phage antirepressor [Rhodococcus aetherivorans]|uniref:phage antirepressor n=1 Tax=Rhodococcus aetherivorans TaxID=191292 RepID=UPI0031D4B168